MSDQKAVHPYVTRLENITQSWAGTVRWAEAPWSISNMYATTLRCALREDDPELKRAALDYFPMVCSMMTEGNIALQVHMVNNVLTLLTQEDNLSALARLPGSERELAWFCCELAVYNADGGLNNQDEVVNVEKFIDLLEAWTLRSFPVRTAPLVENVVDFLYGTSCWSLYGCAGVSSTNHADASEAVRTITQSALPLQCCASQKQEIFAPADVPDNLA